MSGGFPQETRFLDPLSGDFPQETRFLDEKDDLFWGAGVSGATEQGQLPHRRWGGMMVGNWPHN